MVTISAADINCEACSKQLDAMYLLSSASDKLLAKGISISEVAQVARTELRMQRMLLAKWNNRKDHSVSVATRMAINGSSGSSIYKAIDSVMSKWSTDVKRPFTDSITEIYKLSRIASYKKATGQSKASLQYSKADANSLSVEKSKKKTKAKLLPSFDLLDDSAIQALHDDQMMWVGRKYNKNLREGIRTFTEDAIGRGVGRKEAGKIMKEGIENILSGRVSPPGTFKGSSEQYFEMLAANTSTTTRVRGHIRSFVDLDVTKIELINPMDHRTSQICAHLNGKIILIEDGVSQIELESGAKNPKKIKEVHPWLSFEKIKEISPRSGNVSKKDTDALAKAGVVLPPFHAKCRTTVDIVS